MFNRFGKSFLKFSRVSALAAAVTLTVGSAAQASVVLIQQGSVADANTLNSFYNGLSGVSSSILSSGAALDAATLSSVDLFTGIMPTDSYSSREITAVSNFVGSGGTAFFLTENAGFTTAINTVNAMLTGMGSSMSVVGDFEDPGCSLVTASGAQLAGQTTSGVSSFSWGCGSHVDGGTVAMYAVNLTEVIISSEAFGSGVVVISGDGKLTNIFGAGNKQFFENLLSLKTQVAVPEPAAILVLAFDVMGLAAARRRRPVA